LKSKRQCERFHELKSKWFGCSFSLKVGVNVNVELDSLALIEGDTVTVRVEGGLSAAQKVGVRIEQGEHENRKQSQT